MPTDELSYNPNEEKYWQPFENELHRVFEVCNGCRMCFKYCSVFPDLFKLIDDHYDGNVKKVTLADTDKLFEQCFQCRLCEFQCPYTPREGHEFQLDFPQLVHRYQAHKWKKPVKLRFMDRMLGDVNRMGKLARASLGAMNLANNIKINRIIMEKIFGVHREKTLPYFPMETFEKWAKKNGYMDKGVGGEVVLFQTCFIQNSKPEVGRDTIEVLEHNSIDVRCVQGMACCGMPAWEHGDIKSVKKWTKKNIKLLKPYVNKGAKVLVLQPTCSLMISKEWPELVDPEDKEDAQLIADAVMSPSDYLWSIRKEERFNTNYKSLPEGEVIYHVACHVRAQRKGFKGRDLIRKATGQQPKTVDECSGHGGTYAIKVEFFDDSVKWGSKSINALKEPASIRVSDCALATMQFVQHTKKEVIHPMTFLARCYRENGFSNKKTDNKKE
jgi:Fe-S oxidoreductase